jgi:hypothetical protein
MRTNKGVTQNCVANCVTHSQKLRSRAKKGTKKALKNSVFQCFFGLSDKLTNLVLRCLFWQFLTVQESAKRANAMAFAKFRVVKFK